MNILGDTSEYFENKFKSYGPTPSGVGWKDDFAQVNRYKQLLRIVSEESGFSILDFGCGYGKLVELLENSYKNFTYFGVDLSEEMLNFARKAYWNKKNINFFNSGKEQDRKYDYVVASGIFNVKFVSEQSWENYIQRVLTSMYEMSNQAISCNFLSTYNDFDKRDVKLYYADPEKIFEFAMRNLSRKVNILHDYNMFDFTITINK